MEVIYYNFLWIQITKPSGGPDSNDRFQTFPNKYKTCGTPTRTTSLTAMGSMVDFDFRVNDADEFKGFLLRINYPNVNAL